MKRKKHQKNKKTTEKQVKKPFRLALPKESKRKIFGVLIFVLATIVTLGFFDLAGEAGRVILSGLNFLIGNTVFLLPLILVLGGLVFLITPYQKFSGGVTLAILLLVLGISGLLESVTPGSKLGGYFGYLAGPILELFGFWVSLLIFGGIVVIGGLIFWYLLKQPILKEKETKTFPPSSPRAPKPSLIKKIFVPKFTVKEVEPKIKEAPIKTPSFELKSKEIKPAPGLAEDEYQIPPLDLLEAEKGTPSAGDTRINSAIIKKTLENFDIPVEMSEINIGPTVTQYTLKPAEGIKLSKITTLSNDLSLALAAHPIRIEAPIPGKSLVGIEIPNKVRTRARLRDLISNPDFQNSISNLTFVLGKDVSGRPLYTDLAKMPHLLVAGSTGTGKTIFLNSLILSLLYQNGPGILRFIFIDPKRVEFSVYNGLPHLLTPVIFDAQKTVNALRWLISEMERRFNVLSAEKARDIASYNEIVLRNREEPMPYIVLIIDELADLMTSRGREVEVGIVRLAQMARAVGIHLVVATQRPSVEVITGLIKANITSRVTFQVASQVDSRTVLDVAGAEKLLGLGDMLFVSAEIAKPRRIQGAYVSEKEVKKIVDYIKSKPPKESLRFPEGQAEIGINELAEDLEKTLETQESELEGFYGGEDPLYEEAKRTVIQAQKASASLLQRRLRIGYARAARLIDMLEKKGVVGPGEGAKPREVYLGTDEKNPPADGEDWQKI
jgi:S-DNA-T family DNA segregation ATPase FtsK/SpoIIIE